MMLTERVFSLLRPHQLVIMLENSFRGEPIMRRIFSLAIAAAFIVGCQKQQPQTTPPPPTKAELIQIYEFEVHELGSLEQGRIKNDADAAQYAATLIWPNNSPEVDSYAALEKYIRAMPDDRVEDALKTIESVKKEREYKVEEIRKQIKCVNEAKAALDAVRN